MLIENLGQVEKRIEEACKKGKRKREEVTLIAVSKTKPVSMIETIYQAGVREFGENKVQELCEKYELMEKDIHWHMIGHLQRNKVRQVIEKAYLIHSVDSLRLAQQIEQEAAKLEKTVSILVEVNVAKEASKFGIMLEETENFLKEISAFKHISVQGLMTTAPFVENPEENRIYFRKLYQLSVDMKRKNIDNINMQFLSMGMTNDFEVAIEEGANIVRIGTGIFGERNYL
ncbi:MAG: YggS family pyridoxal phosphate-dependent enzyme [Lachnospiraceae bacterium]|nr:YggS family pyridoxal phosphate-dependent enzyme [Lachnospiraceae bacterium]